ncbi:Uncharacterised protein [Vibrio cholerae]|nr:Uncharacterised protein [Vibrio cholerae]
MLTSPFFASRSNRSSAKVAASLLYRPWVIYTKAI